jgi:hypothetical protein
MATYSSFKKIATDALVDSAVTAADVATNAAIAGKFATGAITGAKVATGAVGTSQLASTVDLSGKTVTYRSILNADISATANISSANMATGAMVTNIGYTPVAQTNGTMTGPLIVPAGSTGTPSITQAGNTNTGISFDGSNNINFSAAGVRQLTIDSAGRMLRGSDVNTGTVAFQADGTTGWLYNNSFGGTGWREIGSAFGWSARERGGSNFNNSAGIFTAPVSGFYHFQFQTYGHNDNAGTGNYIHLSFGRNGGVAFAGGRTPHGMFAHGTTNGPYPHGIIMDLSTYLNASDNIRVYTYWNSNGMRFHSSHSTFAGYLVT